MQRCKDERQREPYERVNKEGNNATLVLVITFEKKARKDGSRVLK